MSELSETLIEIFNIFDGAELGGNELRVFVHQKRWLRRGWVKYLTGSQEVDVSGLIAHMEVLAQKLPKEARLEAEGRIHRSRVLALLSGVEDRREAIDKLLDSEAPSVKEAVDRGHERHKGTFESDFDYDLLVVCALYDPELVTFLRRLRHVKDRVGEKFGPFGESTYFIGDLESERGGMGASLRTVAVFQRRTGVVDCAAITTEAIRCFKPRVAAMIGVCAGRQGKRLTLGDLVVPSESLTFDTGKLSQSGFEREPRWTSASESVIQRVSYRADALSRRVAEDLSAELGERINAPTVYTEVMACGSFVVNYDGAFDSISNTHRKVVGIDMESYGFLRAVEMADRRILRFVIKGVMDFGVGKTDVAKGRASMIASRFLELFVGGEYWTLSQETL